MNTTASRFLLLAATSGTLAVLIGAFGAHALESRLSPEMLDVFGTASDYHFYHTFALLVVGLLARDKESKALTASGWAFLAGVVIFSGSLYALAVTGVKMLGAITPIGGVTFIVGWVLLGFAAIRR